MIDQAVLESHAQLEKKVFASQISSRSARSYAPRVLINGYPWYFILNLDCDTIEFQTKPSTLKTLRAVAPYVERQLFQRMEGVGYFANLIDGSSHFNIGLRSAFPRLTTSRVSQRAFLSYFADFHSHAELAAGIWDLDPHNAPPFLEASASDSFNRVRIESFQEALERFEDEPNLPFDQFMDQLISAIRYPSKLASLRIPIHYDQPFEADATIELRSVWMPPEFKYFVLMAELFELRMRHLGRLGFPLKFYPVFDDISRQEKLDRYYLYVTEAGGSWSRYGQLVWPLFDPQTPSRFLTTPIAEWRPSDYRDLVGFAHAREQFPTIDRLLVRAALSPEYLKAVRAVERRRAKDRGCAVLLR